jgi:threonine/homoserine/homoserine lactone efflux protein
MTLLAPDQALAFLGVALLVALSPGPDNLMVLALGASRGSRLGVAFGLGCAIGCLSHTALAALGVGALVAASPWAFTALKVAGGLYLLRLGWLALRSRGGTTLAAVDGPPETALRLFGRGLLANAINPKVVLFFLALLPQFVDSASGGAAAQMAQLGVLFTAAAAFVFGALGLFAGVIGAWLQRHGRAGLWLDRVAGAVFVALGLKLIVGG